MFVITVYVSYFLIHFVFELDLPRRPVASSVVILSIAELISNDDISQRAWNCMDIYMVDWGMFIWLLDNM